MRILVWAVRAIVFLALFALALNNQHAVTLHSLFGLEWHTRMIYVVLAAFIGGCAVGVMAMVPRWWRGRQQAAVMPTATPQADDERTPLAPSLADSPSSQFGAEAAVPPQRENY